MMHSRCSSGGAALEAAIVLPILLFVALGLIFLPLTALYSKIVLTDAAREGARHVAIYNNQYEAEELIAQIITDSGLDPGNIQQPVDFDYTVDGGRYITVTINYLQPVLFPQVAGLVGGDATGDHIALSVSSTFKKEWYVP